MGRQDRHIEEEYKTRRKLPHEQAKNTIINGWRSIKNKDATRIVRQKGREGS